MGRFELLELGTARLCFLFTSFRTGGDAQTTFLEGEFLGGWYLKKGSRSEVSPPGGGGVVWESWKASAVEMCILRSGFRTKFERFHSCGLCRTGVRGFNHDDDIVNWVLPLGKLERIRTLMLLIMVARKC